jgi:hypothetical protein
MKRVLQLLSLTCSVLSDSFIEGFLFPSRKPFVLRSTGSSLFLQKGWFSPDNNHENEDDEDGLVTREMFQRDLLQDPQVKRKLKNGKGGGGYKPLDNRDHLPFAVKKITPDPYTHPQVKNAKRKTAQTKKTDLDHQLTPSRLYQSGDGKDQSTLLGEFKLDKSTTSGDVIVIGDREFRVETARCLYKYAGGQRFVMARKILEVKEVTRAAKEEYLMRQFKQSESDNPPMLD